MLILTSKIFPNLFSFDKVSENVDDLLENVSNNIDILKGIKKDKKEVDIEEELYNIKKDASRQDNTLKISTDKMMENEQDPFDIDNSYYPFIPKIKDKLYPITELSQDIPDARQLRLMNAEKIKNIKFEERKTISNTANFEHPYKDEVVTLMNCIVERCENFNNFYKEKKKQDSNSIIKFEKIQMSDEAEIHKLKDLNSFTKYLFSKGYSDEKADTSELEHLMTHYSYQYLPLDATPLIVVDTRQGLIDMVNDILNNTTEFAMDLEHHNKESFLGFTCLIQISTRYIDYIVDPIKLRGDIQMLNKVTCNPAILKILHGSDFDIEWLQKDFGVFVVNMFDTGQAARILNYSSFSLASLLVYKCNVNADKKYQLADWRIRPLPEEMIKYAREDTHYLLYIYDDLVNNLITQSLYKNDLSPLFKLLLVLKRSNEICLKQYQKPSVKSVEYYQNLSHNARLTKLQLSLFKLVYKFRDYVARKLDLSPHYIMDSKSLQNFVRNDSFAKDKVMMRLEKFKHLRKFASELYELISEKLERVEKQSKNSDQKTLEQNYIDSVKSKLEESKKTVRRLLLPERVVSNNVTVQVSFADLKSKIAINPLTIKAVSSMFDENIQPDIPRCPNINYQSQYNVVVENFKNFSIINALKHKYTLNVKVHKQDNEKKLVTSKIQENVSEEAKFLKNKRKQDMLDVTDNINLIKKQKIDLDESQSEDEEPIDDKTQPSIIAQNLISNASKFKSKFNLKCRFYQKITSL